MVELRRFYLFYIVYFLGASLPDDEELSELPEDEEPDDDELPDEEDPDDDELLC